MVKKIFIATIAVVAGLFILNSTHLGSYAKTAIKKAKAAVKGQVTPEFMLETARNEAAQLIPDMRKNISSVAAKDVAVQRLREEIASIRNNLDKQKDTVRVMKDALKSGTQVAVYNNRELTRSKLSDRLAHELAASQLATQQLTAKEALLESEEKALDGLREQLTNMKAVKGQIDLEISRLETEVQTYRLAQQRTDSFQFDDSRLARIKGMLKDVRDQVAVGLKSIEYGKVYDFEAPQSPEKVKNAAQLIKEAEELLGEGSSEGGKVVDRK
jgi:chromosome segregation ATPase